MGKSYTGVDIIDAGSAEMKYQIKPKKISERFETDSKTRLQGISRNYSYILSSFFRFTSVKLTLDKDKFLTILFFLVITVTRLTRMIRLNIIKKESKKEGEILCIFWKARL